MVCRSPVQIKRRNEEPLFRLLIVKQKENRFGEFVTERIELSLTYNLIAGLYLGTSMYRPINDKINELLQSRLFNYRPKYYNVLTYHRHIPYLIDIIMITLLALFKYLSCMIRDLTEIRLYYKFIPFLFHSFIPSFISIFLFYLSLKCMLKMYLLLGYVLLSWHVYCFLFFCLFVRCVFSFLFCFVLFFGFCCCFCLFGFF